jgi:ribosomal protein S16
VYSYKRSKSGSYIEKLGSYSSANQRFFFINFQRLSFWLNKGVYLNNTVKKIMGKLIARPFKNESLNNVHVKLKNNNKFKEENVIL